MEEIIKVLILDNLEKSGVDVFTREGIQVDVMGTIDATKLTAIVNNYDGIVIRGNTIITKEVLQQTTRLKIIGRAGSGTDNIDKRTATRKGIVVMNTPGGNTITTGEHAIALIMALARKLPQASASMKEGKWEKEKFLGIELTGKTLGIVGMGHIGKVVAERALGLKMMVISYDPYVSPEVISKLGVEHVTLDEIYARSDFITYHTPLTPETRGFINAQSIAKMKKGVYLINCARGALINESDILNALESGQIKGLALDVFPIEPPSPNNTLLKNPNVILTPHLGASTLEAQNKVAILIAEQICDFLKEGMIRNSVNFPSISTELIPILRPYIKLCEKLGSFQGQILDSPLKEIRVEYLGDASKLTTAPLTISVLKGVLQHQTEDVNLVNAQLIAEEREIRVTETKGLKAENYTSMIRVVCFSEKGESSVSGIIFGSALKIVQINRFPIEADLVGGLLMLQNQDVPKVIGSIGTFLGNIGINIAGIQLGRNEPGGTAVCLINVDSPVEKDFLSQIAKLPNITSAKYLTFQC